jgi:trk system potassium uptake protein TrkH
MVLLTPLVLALFEPLGSTEVFSFVAPGLTAIAAGALLWATNRSFDDYQLTFRDATVVITLTWLLAVGCGAVPFIVGGQLAALDAVYESMSGWTTTGLSMLNVEQAPAVYLLWRSTMQFAGGLGLAVLLLASLLGPHSSSFYVAEAREGRLVPNVIETTRVLMKLYVGYFAAGALFLRIAGMSWFDAVNHSMAALSTGGFSTRAASIGHWDNFAVEAVVMALMLLGTTNFATQFAIWSRSRFRDQELSMTIGLLGLGIPLGFWSLLSQFDYGAATGLRIAAFETISAVSTTGFSLGSYAGWPGLNVFLLILFMIIGGGTGATAGGLKQFRVSTMVQSVYWFLRDQTLSRHAVSQRKTWKVGRLVSVTTEAVARIAAYVGLYFLVLILGTLLFTAYGFELQTALFEFGSALGTVGLSLGNTNPALPPVLKLAQIFAMWFGRLEFVAIAVGIARLVRDLRLALVSE